VSQKTQLDRKRWAEESRCALFDGYSFEVDGVEPGGDRRWVGLGYGAGI
jgi:hypothetical protein